LVIARSAEGVNAVVVAVEELLPGFPSAVAELMVAVFDITVLFGTFPICKTSTIVAEPKLAGKLAKLHVTTPAENPQTIEGSLGVADTKLVPGGRTSVTATLDAVLGPPFEMLIVYVAFVPVNAVAGPTLVIDRSAVWAIAEVAAAHRKMAKNTIVCAMPAGRINARSRRPVLWSGGTRGSLSLTSVFGLHKIVIEYNMS